MHNCSDVYKHITNTENLLRRTTAVLEPKLPSTAIYYNPLQLWRNNTIARGCPTMPSMTCFECVRPTHLPDANANANAKGDGGNPIEVDTISNLLSGSFMPLQRCSYSKSFKCAQPGARRDAQTDTPRSPSTNIACTNPLSTDTVHKHS